MKFYPPGTSTILAPFEGELESCFILLHPFLKMENNAFEKKGAEKTSSLKVDSIPEELHKILKRTTLPENPIIYASNQNYPEINDIIENETAVDISYMTKSEFCQTMTSNVLISLNREIMVSQERDTFFCLLFTKHIETMQCILDNFDLEVMLCSESSTVTWEFDELEFQNLLQKEKEQKNKQKQTKRWTRIFE